MLELLRLHLRGSRSSKRWHSRVERPKLQTKEHVSVLLGKLIERYSMVYCKLSLVILINEVFIQFLHKFSGFKARDDSLVIVLI